MAITKYITVVLIAVIFIVLLAAAIHLTGNSLAAKIILLIMFTLCAICA